MKRYRPMQKPLTVDELREMPLFAWAWVEILKPSVFERITYMKHQSAYCKKYRSIDETEFNCGYPGMSYAYYYCDYGKTWIAFRREPTDAERDAAKMEEIC